MSQLSSSAQPIKPSPELSNRLDQLVKEKSSSDEVYDNGLVLYSQYPKGIYIWTIVPGGTVFRHDVDELNPDMELDYLTVYAVLLKGANRFPELHELVPPKPDWIESCGECNGSGWLDGENRECNSCSGFGWVGKNLNPDNNSM